MADNQANQFYDANGNPIPHLVYEDQEEEEEEVGGDTNILNNSQTYQSSSLPTVVFPQTTQIQREIFVLKGDYITPQDAEEFQEQAQRLPRLRINECMHRMAIDLLHVKICTDQTNLSMLTPEQRHDWQNILPIQHVAVLIMQYFCTNKQADHTLAELFCKIPFHYSLSSDEEELTTYMAYRELISDHERTRRITVDKQTELVAILEK